MRVHRNFKSTGRLKRRLQCLVLLVFRFPQKSLKIEYDNNYGINRRSGWTVVVDGITCVQLERWLLVALFRAWLDRFGLDWISLRNGDKR